MDFIGKNDTLDVKEVGDLLGISSSAVSNLRARYENFPSPAANPVTGPVFNEPEIEVWAS